MKSTQASDSWFQGIATRDIHMEQLKKAERFNGRAAMVGIVIGIITEGLPRGESFKRICPDCTFNNPASKRNKMVFPHPEWPIKQVTSPLLLAKEISWSTEFLPNRCDTVSIIST